MSRIYDHCPDCGSTEIVWDASEQAYICEECEWADDEALLAELEAEEAEKNEACPKCGNDQIWDVEAGQCYCCGHTEWRDDPPPKLDEDAEIDAYIAEYYGSLKPSYTGFIEKTWKNYVPAPEPKYEGFNTLVADLKKWPGFRLFDTTHWFNRFVSRFASKMIGFDVTHTPKAFGPVVFMPKDMWETRKGYRVLAHEGTHAKDFWKFGIIPFFLMQYLLPFGPSFKALFEYRAYVATMKADKLLYGSVLETDSQRYADALASKTYTYCFPWKNVMKKWFDKARNAIP